jgi:hypothetical protein
MALKFEDRPVLEAWANGRAGANERLAKRAWLVLQAIERQDPYALGAVASGTGRLHDLLQRYRQMGAMGLLDATRSGRPPSVALAAKSMLHPGAANDGQLAIDSIRTLSRSHREAIWRANRRSGRVLSRDTRLGRYHLRPPPALGHLATLLCLPGLVVTLTTKLSTVASTSAGTWLARLPRLNELLRTHHSTNPFAAAIQISGIAFADDTRSPSSPGRIRDEVIPFIAAGISRCINAGAGPWTLNIFISNRHGDRPIKYLQLLRTQFERKDGQPLLPPQFACTVVVQSYESRPEAIVRAFDGLTCPTDTKECVADLAPLLADETFFCWSR